MNLNKEISNNYARWSRISRGLSRDSDELLHTTLLGIVENAAKFQAFDPEKFRSYVDRALYISALSPRSKLNYKKAITISIDDCHNCTEVTDDVFLHYRIMNEQLDVIIGRLPEYDAIIFRQFILNGCSYNDLNKGTGIPIRTLRRSIELSKKAIKNAISSKRETED